MFKTHRAAYVLLTLTALFWSINVVLAKAMNTALPPMALSVGRWGIALTLLAPFGFPRAWRQRHLLFPYWRRILLLGLTGIGMYNTLVYVGLQSTTATHSVLLNSLIPILIILLGSLFFAQPLQIRQSFGIGISFLGVLAIVTEGNPQHLLEMGINAGDGVILLAMLVWAIYTLILRGMPSGVDKLGLLSVLMVIGLVALLPFFALELAEGRQLEVSASSLLTLGYIGIFPSIVAMIFYNHGVATVGAARAGSFIHLMPAFGTLLAAGLLGEPLAMYHGIGLAGILTGVYLATYENNKRRDAT
jgi:drug/metabolite transporter (DMT)-like permease